jgi:cytosine deaminase
MLHLLIRNASLPDGRTGTDIAIEGGRIVEVRPQIDAQAGEIIEAGGLLVTPPFVDSHFHMDSVLSLGQPRLNESGTLLEGIQIWGELKPDLTPRRSRRGRWPIAAGRSRAGRSPYAAMSISATTGCSPSRPCWR